MFTQPKYGVYNKKIIILKLKKMKEFKIRTYSKQELAMEYFPNSRNTHVAVNHLMAWVKRCKDLHNALTAIGLNKNAKHFTPKEVELIIYHLGEP